MSDPPGTADSLADRVLAGDRRAVARLLRRIDDEDPAALAELRRLYCWTSPRRRIGITGAPGAGKSSLVDRLIAGWRVQGLRVGVVAVDPSSPFSGGAILGDRVRMQGHALDEGVFIRSLASRGRLGGLSASAGRSVTVLEALGCDRIVVETVGVGQSEIEVARLVDTTLVITTPGGGDHVQSLKAGLLEIADLYVVHKADREGADQTARELEQMLALIPRPPGAWTPPVVKTSIVDGTGIDLLLAAVDRHAAHFAADAEARLRRRARAELEDAIGERLRRNAKDRVVGLEPVIDRIARRESDPDSEAELVVP